MSSIISRALVARGGALRCIRMVPACNLSSSSSLNSGYSNSSWRGGGNSYRPRRPSGGAMRNKRRDDQFVDPDAIQFRSNKFTEVTKLSAEDAVDPVTIQGLGDEGLISDQVLTAVKSLKYQELTPVQQRTIKPILQTAGDVVARAKTGTGKTMAFLVPMFQHLCSTNSQASNMVKCVIIAPTRDLALQIQQEIDKLYRGNPQLAKSFPSISLIGGVKTSLDSKLLERKRPNIVVATPGRLLDVLNRHGERYFSAVDFKILDEADTLLEIGFKENLESISDRLNALRRDSDAIRTLLFSATLSDNVQRLANNIMNKESCLFIDTVKKSDHEAHENIKQRMVLSDTFAHNLLAPIDNIKKLLETNKQLKAIFFLPTVKSVVFYSKLLRSMFDDIPITEFHGQVSQNKRTFLVKRFKSATTGIFVCTDVGARGMDFPNIEHVLQLGVPTSLPNYVHRIGRTGRAGKLGTATIFLCKAELPFVTQLKQTKGITIADTEKYEPSPELQKKCSSLLYRNKFELETALKTLLSSYRSVMQEYHLRDDISYTVAKAFPDILGPDHKIKIQRADVAKYVNVRRFDLWKDAFDIDNDDSFQFNRSYSRPSFNKRSSGGWGNRPQRSNYNQGYNEDFNPRIN